MPGSGFGRSHRADPEGDEQIVLFAWLLLQHPKAWEMAFHVPNGGKRSKREGARFKAQGVKAGIPDVFIDIPRGGYHGFRMEFKATPPKDAAIQENQKEWIVKFTDNGYYAVICKGFDAAKAAINYYLGLPKQGDTDE